MREPREIIADWLSGFVGDDKPTEAWLPNADSLLLWLHDEGWQVALRPGTVTIPVDPPVTLDAGTYRVSLAGGRVSFEPVQPDGGES